MADFDLSMVATFDASSVSAGSKQVADSIDKVAAAETRAGKATRESATVNAQAAAAERAREKSLADIMRLLDPTFAGQQKLNRSLAEASKLYKEGALTAAQYAKVQKLAADGMNNAAQSAGAARAAYTNLGFQISDITQSLALGISPFVVFGQQAGQTAAAVAGMGGVLGRVGTFLSGPFGSIILGAVTVVGLLASKLFETADAADDAGDAAADFADRQLDLGNFIDKTTGKLIEQNAVLRENAILLRQGEITKKQNSILDKQNAAFGLAAQLGNGNRTQSLTGREGVTVPQTDPAIQAAIQRSGGNAFRLQRELQALNRPGLKPVIDQIGSLNAQAILTARDVQRLGLENVAIGGGTVDKSLLDPKRTRATRSRSGGDDAAFKKAQLLDKLGERIEERISRINEAFDETPKLIDRANQASRELDAIIADLQKRKPPGFEEMIKSAEAAKGVVAESLNRPFQELLENSEKRLNIDKLIGAGREDEARALEIIYQLEERVGEVKDEQRAAILDMVRNEREINEILEQRQELTDAYLSATQNVKNEIESILSGRGGNVLKTLQQSFRDIQGKILTEKLFGPALRELDKFVKEENGIDAAVDIFAGQTKRAGTEAGTLADAFVKAAKVIGGAVSPAAGYSAPSVAGGASGAPGGPTSPASEASIENQTGEIVALGSKIDKTALGLSPDDYFKRLTSDLTSPLLDGLDEALGTDFFSGLQGVLSGVLYGLATGGKPGGVLGGLKGLNDKFGADVFGKELAGEIGGFLSTALSGSQTGTQVAGLAKSIGIKKFSTTGSQIGGAIGSATGIPGGDLIGSIIGGTIGGLFKKTPYGTAVVSGSGDPTVTGNKSAARDVAAGLGGSVQSALASIAEQLDADLGSFLVSIGTYKGKTRVSTTGRSGKLKTKFADVKDFGKDGEEAALAFAIQTAIGQGAIKGISEAMQKALKSSPDINKAVKEALAVRDLEDLISGLTDLERAFRDFDKTAEERVRLAKAYGLDLLAVERVNADERKKLLDQALEAQVGSLKDLLNDLNYGSLFEGTATQRRAQILAEIADAEEDIQNNVAGAIDRYADLQRQLVETSREAFGTAGTEFGTDRAAAISNAERIIALENERILAAAAKQQEALDAATQNNTLTNETNNLIAIGNTQLSTIAQQLSNLSVSGSLVSNPIARGVVVPF
jgi:hypothetical protein